MPANVAGAIDVPCSLFAGLNTELSPSDIPEGVSPDNNDMAFVPGSARQRPAAQKIIQPHYSNVSIVYHKTYVQPNGDPLTLYLASDGELLMEDVNSLPGQVNPLRMPLIPPISDGCNPGAAGSYAKSVTAFGREYIAFSDGTHGLDVPRQYDGTTLSRVTQDGPGTLNLTISQQQVTVGVNAIGPIVPLTIASVTEYQTLVTVTTTTAHNLVVNDQVIVDCINQIFSDYGNAILVEQINSPTSFSYTIGVTNIAAVSGGTVYPLKVVLTSLAPHGLFLGDNFTVAANSWPLYNSGTSYGTGATGFPVTFNWTLAGKPPAGTAYPVQQIAQTVNFPPNFAGSSGSCKVNPTEGFPNYATFGVDTVGPLGYRHLGVVRVHPDGTFNFDSSGQAVTIYPGEWLYVYTPNPQDATLSDVSITFLGNGLLVNTTPPMWTVTEVLSPYTLRFDSVSKDVQVGTGGTLTVGGQISGGEHKLVAFLETYDGEQTNPSPPVAFTATSGSRVTISNLPTVYTNIKSINFAFTLSAGGNYFYIPVTPTGVSIYGTKQAIGTSTVVSPTTGSVTFNFSDTTLAGAIAIDIPGNNLFAQVKLAPCLGFFSYASRLIAWGEPNVVVNLMNTGFDGGYDSVAPHQATGWQTAGGYLPFNFTVTQDGYSPGQAVAASGAGNYRLYQGAYQDAYGVAILQPLTKYRVKLRATATNPAWGGTLTVALTSPSLGSLVGGDVTIQISSLVATLATTDSAWVTADFTAKTPTVIPSDARFQITATLPALQQLVLDEVMVIYLERPYKNVARVSYVDNPGGFDNITGILGTTDDPSEIKCFSTIRETLYMKTEAGHHRTQDNPGAEPSGWSIKEISRKVGALSFRSADPGQYGSGDTGEEWELVAARGGLYIFAGGPFYKISQEIQSIWDRINFAVKHTIWLKNDSVTRRCYIGVPLDGATSPNVVLVMDYRELDTAENIAVATPIHISFTGKMIASDLTRKWTIWTLATCSGELIERPDPIGIQFTIGCGNGTTPGTEPSFGNVYWFNPAKYVDDDYGHIPASYTTYFFVNHEAEIALQVGSHRKLFYFLSAFVTGQGSILITPKAAALTNPWPSLPSYPLSPTQSHDLEWGVNVLTERCAFTFQVIAPSFAADSWFDLQKMVVAIKPDPWSPVRGLI